MKVLLNKKTISFRIILIDTLLVWFLTNLLGSTAFPLFTDFEWTAAFMMSSLFSSPAAILGIANFYILHSIQKRRNRIAYALLSIATLCALLYVVLYMSFDDVFRMTELASWMSPYAIAAEITFFFVASGYILKPDIQTESNPSGI